MNQLNVNSKYQITIIKLLNIAFLVLLLLFSSGQASAVGIYGNVEILSNLNQPLKLRFPIIVEGEQWDENDIRLKIASRKEYSKLELPYPKNIHKLKFTISPKQNGRINVLATTRSSVREPIVSLILYLQWPKGKIRYEFTLLLDLEEQNIESENVIAQTLYKPITSQDSVLQATPIKVDSNNNYQQYNVVTDPIKKQVEPASNKNSHPTTLAEPLFIVTPLEKSQNLSDLSQIEPAKQDIASEIEITTAPKIVWTSKNKTHTIKKGDSLSIVAMNYRGGTNIALHKYIAAIIDLNAKKFRNGLNDISVGDTLLIPNPKRVINKKAKAVHLSHKLSTPYFQYKVRYGDILSLLAQKFRGKEKIRLNAYIQQIIDANKGVLNNKGNNLYSGMLLNIPNLSYKPSQVAPKTIQKPVISKPVKKKITEIKTKLKEKPQLNKRLATNLAKESNKNKANIFANSNSQLMYPLLLSHQELKQRSLLSQLNNKSDYANKGKYFIKGIDEVASTANQKPIVIGNTALINSNNFRIKKNNVPNANGLVPQAENTQKYKTLQVSYRYLQQQMELQQREYEQTISNIKIGFFVLLAVFVLLFIAFHLYMQKTMHRKFEKWLDDSKVSFTTDEQETTNEVDSEREELEDALATIFDLDDDEKEVAIETKVDEPEKQAVSPSLKASLMDIVRSKFAKKEKPALIDKPMFKNNAEVGSETEYIEETDFVHTEESRETSVDEIDLDFSETGSVTEKIDNEFSDTIKLKQPAVKQADENLLALANQPVQQPVLPEDIGSIDDEDLAYTSDIEGELEKEKQRLIAKLEERSPHTPIDKKDEDLVRFSKPIAELENDSSEKNTTEGTLPEDELELFLQYTNEKLKLDDNKGLKLVKKKEEVISEEKKEEKFLLNDAINYLRGEIHQEEMNRLNEKGSEEENIYNDLSLHLNNDLNEDKWLNENKDNDDSDIDAFIGNQPENATNDHGVDIEIDSKKETEKSVADEDEMEALFELPEEQQETRVSSDTVEGSQEEEVDELALILQYTNQQIKEETTTPKKEPIRLVDNDFDLKSDTAINNDVIYTTEFLADDANADPLHKEKVQASMRFVEKEANKKDITEVNDSFDDLSFKEFKLEHADSTDEYNLDAELDMDSLDIDELYKKEKNKL